MKKPYSPNLSALRRRPTFLSRYTLRVAGLFVGFALILLGLRIFLPDILTAVASPFWSFGSGATHALGGLGDSFTSKVTLISDRDRLMNDNATLTENNRVLEAKVADLERLIGSAQSKPNGILAGVLVRPPVTPYDTLVIDAGTKAGVSPSALVYGPGGVPLGTVESVSAGGSRVSLYSAPGRASEGWIGDNRLALMLTGRGAGAFEATLPHAAGIVVGATVYLPGPGAVPVGTVVRVDSDPSSPRDTLHIQSYQSPFSLTWVMIASRP